MNGVHYSIILGIRNLDIPNMGMLHPVYPHLGHPHVLGHPMGSIGAQQCGIIDHQKLKYALKLANLWGYIKSTKLARLPAS